MTLGRPLGISSMGDCPSPESTIPNPNAVSLSNYMSHFSLLARQILSSGTLSNTQIDKYSDDLLSLHSTLTSQMRLDATWLNEDKAVPPWPLDAQASLLHAKTHNLLILLNRQRAEKEKDRDRSNTSRFSRMNSNNNASHSPRGRERVLQSCRSLLMAFEFMKTRCEAGLTCWTMGQMAFNAAMLLTLSMLETGETKDLLPLQHVYSTFLDMNKLGIHKLAGAAVDRLGALMKEFRSDDFANQTVMGHQTMMLLEDPGLPVTSPSEDFFSLSDPMGSGSGFNPGALLRAATNHRPRTESSPFPRKRAGAGGRKQGGSSRDSLHHNKTPQQQRASKKAAAAAAAVAASSASSSSQSSKAQRQPTDRRASDSVTPRPQQRRRTNRSTPNVTLMTPQHPGQSVFSANTTPTAKHETLYSTQQQQQQQTFGTYPTDNPTSQYTTSSHHNHSHNHNHNPHDLHLNLDSMHPHPHHPSLHHHHHDPHNHHPPNTATTADFTFSTHSSSTPYSSEFFDDSLPPPTHSSSSSSSLVDHHQHHQQHHDQQQHQHQHQHQDSPFSASAGFNLVHDSIGGVGGFGAQF